MLREIILFLLLQPFCDHYVEYEGLSNLYCKCVTEITVETLSLPILYVQMN